jgi:hypothetical protein
MNGPPSYIKVKQVPANELAGVVSLSDDARALLKPEMTAGEFFDLLREKELLVDAIRFLSTALPPREAVWWACVCTRANFPPAAAAPVTAALQAAESWVYRPDEETRRAAKAAADNSKMQSGAGWCAMAAFWSGGSITAPSAPAVEPSPKLLPAAVSGAIVLAAVQHEPQRAGERHRQFLDAGIDIANGGNGRPKQTAG